MQSTDKIPNGWLLPLRILTVIIALVSLGIYAAGVPILFEELTQPCIEEPCGPMTLDPEPYQVVIESGVPIEAYATYQAGTELFFVILLNTLAAVILIRRSDTWMGLLTVYMLALFGSSFLTEADAALAAQYSAFRLPVHYIANVTMIVVLTFLYVFPSGRFAFKWTRWVVLMFAIFALIAPLTPIGDMGNPEYVRGPVYAVQLAVIGLGIATQIYRFRKVSDPVQKQQTKWVLLGLIGIGIAIFTWALFIETLQLSPEMRVFVNIFIFGTLIVVLTVFPVSLTISILKYRLWDVDIIIRRTLQYSVVTAILALTYFGGVVLLQSAFRAITGSESSIAVVITTLGIAALFNPLRQRIQAVVDRRFYRRRVNAEFALERLSSQLRDEVDLDEIHEHLVEVVHQTLQPEHVSVWLTEATDQNQAFS